MLVKISVEGELSPEQAKRQRALKKYSQMLKSTEIFQDLTTRELLRVMNLAQSKRYGKDDPVMERGKPCQYFGVVVEGSIKVVAAGGIERNYAVGDAFGAEALMIDNLCLTTADAREPTRVMVLPGNRLRKMMRNRPRIGFKLHRRLSESLLKRLSRKH